MYSIGAYSSWFDATDLKWGGNGSVTVMAVILAPVSLAKCMACSTALVARSDPSVGTRMFLNNLVLLSVPVSGRKMAESCVSVVGRRNYADRLLRTLGLMRLIGRSRSASDFSAACRPNVVTADQGLVIY